MDELQQELENDAVFDRLREDEDLARERALKSKKCYKCGGKIETRATSPDGNSWITECLDCDELYDED